jgi:hypothetical protein
LSGFAAGPVATSICRGAAPVTARTTATRSFAGDPVASVVYRSAPLANCFATLAFTAPRGIDGLNDFLFFSDVASVDISTRRHAYYHALGHGRLSGLGSITPWD